MITYLGMTMPMAIWSTITWIKNPSKENGNEVAIQKLNRKHVAALIFFCFIVIKYWAVGSRGMTHAKTMRELR